MSDTRAQTPVRCQAQGLRHQSGVRHTVLDMVLGVSARYWHQTWWVSGGPPVREGVAVLEMGVHKGVAVLETGVHKGVAVLEMGVHNILCG